MAADITIRPEQPGDAPAVFAVHRRAFPTLDEAHLVDRLRDNGDLVVSLVAVSEDAIVAHVAFSQLAITGIQNVKAAALAPVAVSERWRRQGIAARLIREGLVAAEALGYHAVILLGEPAYYRRFGFSPGLALAFPSVYSGSDAYQAVELRRGIAESGPYEVRYPPAFGALGEGLPD